MRLAQFPFDTDPPQLVARRFLAEFSASLDITIAAGYLPKIDESAFSRTRIRNAELASAQIGKITGAVVEATDAQTARSRRPNSVPARSPQNAAGHGTFVRNVFKIEEY